MLTVEQSKLGEAASLLEQAGGQTIVITDGDIEVGAIVSKERLDRMKRAAWEEIDRISQHASARVIEHAAELGISPEELVERLLQDDDL